MDLRDTTKGQKAANFQRDPNTSTYKKSILSISFGRNSFWTNFWPEFWRDCFIFGRIFGRNIFWPEYFQPKFWPDVSARCFDRNNLPFKEKINLK
jgi:hypothetical protein